MEPSELPKLDPRHLANIPLDAAYPPYLLAGNWHTDPTNSDGGYFAESTSYIDGPTLSQPPDMKGGLELFDMQSQCPPLPEPSLGLGIYGQTTSLPEIDASFATGLAQGDMPKEERVRKPVWLPNDVRLLNEAVEALRVARPIPTVGPRSSCPSIIAPCLTLRNKILPLDRPEPGRPAKDYAIREADFYYRVRGPALSAKPTRKLKTGSANPIETEEGGVMGWFSKLFGAGKTKEKGKGFEVVRSHRAMDIEEGGPVMTLIKERVLECGRRLVARR
ncbi:hypothetical protein KEM56_002747, partial [Ascosphaera pollenicola]